MNSAIQGEPVRSTHHIAAVVPAYNEESQLWNTLEGLPPWIRSIIVVDDGSTDSTAEIAYSWKRKDTRLVLLRHAERQGVGAAIRSGYIWCRDKGVDAAVVMAGDGQMDPHDLPALLKPVLQGDAHYAKGNRFAHPTCWSRMPAHRYMGTWVLSWLTKIISGYWHSFDSQSGFTAIGKDALESLPLEDIYPGYGVPNDILVSLSILGLTVIDVPIVPVYGVGEKSKMNLPWVSVTLSLLLVRLSLKKLRHGLPFLSKSKRQRQLEVATAFQDSSPS